ncbi:MAG: glycosyltransferase [Gammaproteobacteria bacterium]|jgi:glycosyltransferase involved in cell wall biosynthesis|nr:glycosyltransferase [Gammaproteobacteria bacterium]MDP6617359.1 glycosyltransferase [Gammaproteobacteria bacterium]MDP6694920.1 glycosyltransferase [Gammaproteobacteria bacterium]MDP7041350.1 glycosyltransferase [Gammaproteobacteria bacterium]
MSASSTISVVIPAYNAEAFVVEAVESAFAQTVAPLEVIVVNDGSTDRTEELLRGFGDRITLISQQNSGVARARNAGLEVAVGEYVAFLDSDDAWLPDKTAKQLDVMQSYPDMAALGSDCIEVDPDGQVIRKVVSEAYGNTFWISHEPPLIDRSDIGDNLMRNTLGSPSGLLVRRACLEEVQLFDESLVNGSEDWDLFIRLALKFRTAVYADQLFRYRITGEGLCSPKNAERLLKTDLMVLDKIFNSGDLEVSWWLRRKAYGNRYFRNSQAFMDNWQFSRSRSTLLTAIAYWPTLLLQRATIFMLIALVMGEGWVRKRRAAGA